MKLKILIAVVVVIALCMVSCGGNGGNKQKSGEVKILVVHSYHRTYPWTRAIDDGVMSVLGNRGYKIKTFFMDTIRNPEEELKRNAGKNALAMVEQFKPIVVIASDDNAQQYVGKFLVDKQNISIVFCGVNEDISEYGYPGNNVTGIREQPFIRGGLELLKKVAPRVNSYTIITDNSNTSRGFVDYLEELELPIRIDNTILTDDYDRWKSEVKSIKSDAVITYIYTNIKEKGKRVNPGTVLSWTIENLNKPSIGFADFVIEGGVLLGNVESGYEHGQLAAQMALEIIKGKTTREIPITNARKGLILVNAKTAKKLGIDIAPIEKIADKVINEP